MKVKRIAPPGQPDDTSAWIAEILFQEDPLRISIGINADEYESEAGTIAPRLQKAVDAEDVLDIVHEEFCAWFGSDDAGDRSRYRAASARIWERWHRQAGTKPPAEGLAGLVGNSKSGSTARPPER